MYLIKGKLNLRNKYELFDSAKSIDVAMYLLEEYKLKYKNATFKIQYKRIPL